MNRINFSRLLLLCIYNDMHTMETAGIISENRRNEHKINAVESPNGNRYCIQVG